MSSIVNTISNASDSDDERYEEELVCRRQEADRCLRLQEEQEQAERQARKEARAAAEQARRKNWMKTFLLPLSLPSDKKMNLIDLPPLTKRQRVRYLPKETPEARQQCEELAREMGVSVVGGGSPCERCADFGILCIPQKFAVSNFPLVNFVLKISS